VYTRKGNLNPGSKESDELKCFHLIQKAYENTYLTNPPPAQPLLDAIKFRLEQLNMSELELSEILSEPDPGNQRYR
jgi:HTH-type transcriptional regulator/antitoxin HigA